MSYLEDFRIHIGEQQFSRFLHLWEEYCLSDQIDGKELLKILQSIKDSPFTESFGEIAETVIPLWEKVEDENLSGEVLRLIIDLQTTSSPKLADLAIQFLKKRYGDDRDFNEKLRLIGLRSRDNFQGSISRFQLLSHMDKGKFVFHAGGWGVGEVLNMSLLQEHVVIEFEGIAAPKDLSFENAFKNLIPLSSDHFLARRFGDPDGLEKDGRRDPASLVKLLLRDLGPKTASEIKDELCELVIPEEDWAKWWQGARARIKKETQIISPKNQKSHFALVEEEVTHESRFRADLERAKTVDTLILTVYNYTRDFPEVFKSADLKAALKNRLLEAQEMAKESPFTEERKLALHLQLLLLLEDLFEDEYSAEFKKRIQSLKETETVLKEIEIIAFKKKALVEIRSSREDWLPIFLKLLFAIPQNTLRDYLLKELLSEKKAQEQVRAKLKELLSRMSLYPDAFFWYFQKIIAEEPVPFADKEHQTQFLEAYLILLHFIEQKPEYRDLVKKMYQLLTAKRYAIIRAVIEGASIEYLSEFLLLASKCQTFSKQDMSIFQSLSEVVRPEMAGKKKVKTDDVIWTTQEGYQKIQERIQLIGTVEIVNNAKEIEAARALGDLRENSEYKFALEKRSRLQTELKTLSRQFQKARIIMKEDILTEEVGVGAIVDLLDSKGRKITYTLLGPWDADPEKNILSLESKLAQAMLGHRKGDKFEFQGEHFLIDDIKSYLT